MPSYIYFFVTVGLKYFIINNYSFTLLRYLSVRSLNGFNIYNILKIMPCNMYTVFLKSKLYNTNHEIASLGSLNGLTFCNFYALMHLYMVSIYVCKIVHQHARYLNAKLFIIFEGFIKTLFTFFATTRFRKCTLTINCDLDL